MPRTLRLMTPVTGGPLAAKLKPEPNSWVETPPVMRPSDVDVAPELGRPRLWSGADRDVLEERAVGTELGVGVDHDALRVGQQQAPAELETVQRDVGAADDGPETVPRDGELGFEAAQRSAPLARPRVIPQRRDELA